MRKDFKCDKCDKPLAIDELGYMGSEDESCSSLTEIVTLCKGCYKLFKEDKKQSK